MTTVKKNIAFIANQKHIGIIVIRDERFFVTLL